MLTKSQMNRRFKTKNYDHKFSEMREHMFYGDNLDRLMKNIIDTTPNLQKDNDILSRVNITLPNNQHKFAQKTKTKTKIKNNFLCKQRDRLFWAFYVSTQGIQEFMSLSQHSFSTEKDFKFKTIEILRTKSSQLKMAKVSLHDAESELAIAQKLSLVGLEALCIAYDVSMLYIVDEAYYDFNHGGENYKLIERVGKGCNVVLDDIDNKVSKAKESLFFMNRSKPVKGIGSYLISELKMIANKLGIKTINDVGKPFTKKHLYEMIVLKTGKLHQTA